jgi:hypothetical protein
LPLGLVLACIYFEDRNKNFELMHGSVEIFTPN